MRNFLIVWMFTFFPAFGQVGIGTDDPQATLDVNGTMRIAELPIDLSSNQVLVIGDNNMVSQKSMPTFYAISGMEIPGCRDGYVGKTDDFYVSVNGINYTVTSTIMVLTEGTTSYSNGNPIRAQRMQVKYDFSPALPFNPDGFSLTGYNSGGSSETFSLNYTAKSASSITINITRTDESSKGSNYNGGNDCWTDTFFFDMTLYNYN